MSDELFLTQDHPSFFRDQQYVYPVIGRRAGGVSIGINLSQSQKCNFRCIYCQVGHERINQPTLLASQKSKSDDIDLGKLHFELKKTAQQVLNGRIFEDSWFSHAPEDKRILKDFAFSGDGEPTLSSHFPLAVQTVVDVRRELRLDEVKIVLITNATCLQKPTVAEALKLLIENNGEIWAKLDAGSDCCYQTMNRSSVPFSTILDNILFVAQSWGVVIQTMLLRSNGELPSEVEILKYCQQLNQIQEKGGTIRQLQLYTVAREPLENNVVALSNEEMKRLGTFIRSKTSLNPQIFYSH